MCSCSFRCETRKCLGRGVIMVNNPAVDNIPSSASSRRFCPQKNGLERCSSAASGAVTLNERMSASGDLYGSPQNEITHPPQHSHTLSQILRHHSCKLTSAAAAGVESNQPTSPMSSPPSPLLRGWWWGGHLSLYTEAPPPCTCSPLTRDLADCDASALLNYGCTQY